MCRSASAHFPPETRLHRKDFEENDGPRTLNINGFRSQWYEYNGRSAHLAHIKKMANRKPPLEANTPARFVEASSAIGAKGMWMLNMCTSTLEEQLALLREAEKAGAEIEWVELGNEFYFALPEYRRSFPTVQAYLDTARSWQRAIHAEFPKARCAIVAYGKNDLHDEKPRRKTWDAELSAGLNDGEPFGAVTVHIYVQSPLYAKALQLAEKRGVVLPQQKRMLGQSPAFRGLLEEIREEPGLTDLVVRDVRKRIEEVVQGPVWTEIPNVPVWITEYNLFDVGSDGLGGTWSHAMALTAMTLDLAANPRVELAMVHNLVGNPGFALLQPTDENGIEVTAPGSAFSVLSRELNSGGNFTAHGDLSWKLTRTDGSGTIFFLNPGDQSVQWPDVFSKEFPVMVMSAEALAAQVHEKVLLQNETLPPRSLVIQHITP